MEGAAHGIHAVLKALMSSKTPEDALMEYVRTLEVDLAEAKDITLFIFALRTFFCWHDAPKLLDTPKGVAKIREAWIIQNDETYTKWLASGEDNTETLKWAKWTFQAKMTILDEFLQVKN